MRRSLQFFSVRTKTIGLWRRIMTSAMHIVVKGACLGNLGNGFLRVLGEHNKFSLKPKRTKPFQKMAMPQKSNSASASPSRLSG